jgi:ABC-type antimicrobial peptide transport system permease subunit
LVVKTKGDPAALAATVQREVFALDPDQSLSNVTSMEALVDRAIARSRFNGIVLAALAASAIALAAIGIYGLLSYMVSQRTSEIGIRVAVGASPRRIVLLILAGGLKMTLVGTVCGLAAAGLASPLLTALLFDINHLDPGSYVTAAGLLLIAAILACVVPALRAALVDPVKALQSE